MKLSSTLKRFTRWIIIIITSSTMSTDWSVYYHWLEILIATRNANSEINFPKVNLCWVKIVKLMCNSLFSFQSIKLFAVNLNVIKWYAVIRDYMGLVERENLIIHQIFSQRVLWRLYCDHSSVQERSIRQHQSINWECINDCIICCQAFPYPCTYICVLCLLI